MTLLICYNLSVIWPLLRMGDMFREFLSVKTLCLRMRDSCWVPGTKKLTIVSDGQSGDSDRIHSMQHHKITPKSYNIIYQ